MVTLKPKLHEKIWNRHINKNLKKQENSSSRPVGLAEPCVGLPPVVGVQPPRHCLPLPEGRYHRLLLLQAPPQLLHLPPHLPGGLGGECYWKLICSTSVWMPHFKNFRLKVCVRVWWRDLKRYVMQETSLLDLWVGSWNKVLSLWLSGDERGCHTTIINMNNEL